MKKILTISVIIIALIVLLGFLFWPKAGEAPQVVVDGLPFGSGADATSTPLIAEGEVPRITGSEYGDDTEEQREKLFKLSSEPVAGFVILKRATTTVVRYADRATGHIYDVSLPGVEKVRVTNNTIPKIYEAVFRDDGSAVLLRSLKNDSDSIENLTLNLASTTLASLMPSGIDSPLALSGNTLLYAEKNSGAILSSSFTGTNLKQVFSSPFNGWRISKLGGDLLLYPKASAYANGYAYRLTLGGSFNKVLGPLKALTIVGDSSGKLVLYSYSDGGTKFFTSNLVSGETSEILPTTLAEKCVWSALKESTFYCGAPKGGINTLEPDSWYQGKTHFSDYIWSFSLENDAGSLVIDPPSEYDVNVDIINPVLSQDEKYLLFINKNDLTLWGIAF